MQQSTNIFSQQQRAFKNCYGLLQKFTAKNNNKTETVLLALAAAAQFHTKTFKKFNASPRIRGHKNYITGIEKSGPLFKLAEKSISFPCPFCWLIASHHIDLSESN